MHLLIKQFCSPGDSTKGCTECRDAHSAAAVLAVYDARLLDGANFLEEGHQIVICVRPGYSLDHDLHTHIQYSKSRSHVLAAQDAPLQVERAVAQSMLGAASSLLPGAEQRKRQQGLHEAGRWEAKQGMPWLEVRSKSAMCMRSSQAEAACLEAAGLLRLPLGASAAAALLGPTATSAPAAAALWAPRVGALYVVLAVVLLHIAVLAVLTHQDLAPRHLLAIEGVHRGHRLNSGHTAS